MATLASSVAAAACGTQADTGGCSTTGSPPAICDAGTTCGCQIFSFALSGDPSACGLKFGVPCGPNAPALCAALCHTSDAACTLDNTAGNNQVICKVGPAGACCTGRRPKGLALVPATGTVLGRWLADVAALEAASVHAFATVRKELAAHRAPRRLLWALERAKRDEERHARMTGALARRHGSLPRTPRIESQGVRSLEDIARENVAEGCVRETYGALVAIWQAHSARDESVRAAMMRIARDETRHAALAWDIARWADARLKPEARARVRRARDRSVAELKVEIWRDPPPALVRAAGLPRARTAQALLEEVARRLWA
jgi:hypothetical protein